MKRAKKAEVINLHSRRSENWFIKVCSEQMERDSHFKAELFQICLKFHIGGRLPKNHALCGISVPRRVFERLWSIHETMFSRYVDLLCDESKTECPPAAKAPAKVLTFRIAK